MTMDNLNFASWGFQVLQREAPLLKSRRKEVNFCPIAVIIPVAVTSTSRDVSASKRSTDILRNMVERRAECLHNLIYEEKDMAHCHKCSNYIHPAHLNENTNTPVCPECHFQEFPILTRNKSTKTVEVSLGALNRQQRVSPYGLLSCGFCSQAESEHSDKQTHFGGSPMQASQNETKTRWASVPLSPLKQVSAFHKRSAFSSISNVSLSAKNLYRRSKHSELCDGKNHSRLGEWRQDGDLEAGTANTKPSCK